MRHGVERPGPFYEISDSPHSMAWGCQMDILVDESALEISEIETGRNFPEGAERMKSLELLAAWYTGKLLGRLPFSPSLFVLARNLLDEKAGDELDAQFLPFLRSEDSNLRSSGLIIRSVCRAMGQWLKPAGNEGAAVDPIFVRQKVMETFEATYKGKRFVDPNFPIRKKLARIFGLTKVEVNILCFHRLCDQHLDMNTYIEDFSSQEIGRVEAICADTDQTTVAGLINKDGKLVSMGFLQRRDHTSYSPLSDDMSSFFDNSDSFFSFVRPIVSQDEPSIYELSSFPVDSFSKDMIKAALRGKRGSILIHGIPGSGKTSFALETIRAAGRAAFSLSANGGLDDGRPAALRLSAAAHIVKNSGGILLVDEADTLLNTEKRTSEGERLSRAWLTEFMDQADFPLVWIANDIEYLHEAIRRRFLYSLEFGEQSECQRVMLWKKIIKMRGLEGLIPDEELAGLAKKHRVNAGGIEVALQGLATILAVEGDQTKRSPGVIVSEVLHRYELLVSGRSDAVQKNGRREDQFFLPEALNVDVPLGELSEALGGIASSIIERREREALGGLVFALDRREDAPEAKLLFSGPPGTGKTAYAHWLAESLGLRIDQKRASDLLDPYVGMTEKNIARAFAESETSGSILLLDEADTLFLDRGTAQRSWEKSQTNELLTRMEEFSGILICCTNLRSDFDSATMRRFQWKVTFDAPNASQRQLLYRRYFADLAAAPDETTLASLARLEGLCPGDFAAVFKALKLLRSSPREKELISPGELIGRLEKELSYKIKGGQRKIGFVG